MDNNTELKQNLIARSGTNVAKCMKCGKCSATCPSYDEMEYHPHNFVAMVDSGDIEKLMESDSIYKCLSCMACVERCPRGVEPGKLVEAVRLVSIRRKGENHLLADSIPSLVDEDLPGQALVTAFRKYTK